MKLQGWEEAGTLWDELAVGYILPPSSMKDGGRIDPISPEAETIAL